MADSVLRFLFRGDPKGAVQAFKQVDAAAGSLDGKFRAAATATRGLSVPRTRGDEPAPCDSLAG